MKQIITLAFFVFLSVYSFGQIEKITPVTPEIIQKIKLEVDKAAVTFKQSLTKEDDMSKAEIEYSVDTFKLQQIALKEVDIDYSTPGINNATNEVTAGYDKLMNKYYKLLLQLLDADDKKVLINAQRVWLQFRESEMKLVNVLSKDQYSGGGTVQLNIVVNDYSNLVIKRTDQLFNYYETTVGGR